MLFFGVDVFVKTWLWSSTNASNWGKPYKHLEILEDQILESIIVVPLAPSKSYQKGATVLYSGIHMLNWTSRSLRFLMSWGLSNPTRNKEP